jgi:hypothetical protein
LEASVGLVDKGLSALGRLALLAGLLLVFMFGMVGVVYMALQGSEIKVPEITGKDLHESEKELAALGLKIKKRADRVSAEKPDTIIEQLPKPGETVKTGQMILVVTSKGGGEGNVPLPPKNATEEDDTEKIEEMISEKPKKAKSNSNTTRKKADTARDVDSNSSNSNSGSNSSESDSKKKDPESGTNSADKNKETQPTPARTPTATKPGASEPKPKATVKP